MARGNEQAPSKMKDGDELSFGMELEFLFIYKVAGKYKYAWSPDPEEDGDRDSVNITFIPRFNTLRCSHCLDELPNAHYHCSSHAVFDLCQKCFNRGVTCEQDPSHRLVKRFIDDPVSSPTPAPSVMPRAWLAREAFDRKLYGDPSNFGGKLPPAPKYISDSASGYDWDGPRKWAIGEMNKAILSVPGAKIEQQPPPAGTADHYRSMYVVTVDGGKFSGWNLEDDPSVRDDMNLPEGYGVLSFELNSPTLWDRPESHQHVFRVIQALAKRFCLRVNHSTGFHCHVGAGEKYREGEIPDNENTPDPSVRSDSGWGWSDTDGGNRNAPVEARRHSLGVLKRAAALMWAADPFLCHAHPPERAACNYCPSIRFTSRLAHGVALRYVRAGRQYLERELPLDDTIPSGPPNNTTTPPLPAETLPSGTFPRLTTQYLPARRSALLPPSARQRVKDCETFRDNNPSYAKLLKNKTVYSGVRHIMRCVNRGEVANLMYRPLTTGAFPRANYNFTHYLPGPQGAKSTIEFREAAGTMDPLWVGVWASVCLAIFRFARDATEEKFWGVIDRLAKAEEEEEKTGKVGKGKYDLVSLLFDWGLFAEGVYLEKKLKVEDPETFWFPCRVLNPNAGDDDLNSSFVMVNNSTQRPPTPEAGFSWRE